MLEHIERLKAWQALDLPSGIERLVHQNRLLKIAREGGQMTPADLAKFEPQRRYGSGPGRTFYTHISDQYAPFHTKVVNVGVRDSTYVLDGLLYHESDLRIEEHYTDTAGYTDHVFAMHQLGFRFAPRRVLQPPGRNPRPQFRAAALPGLWPQPCDGGCCVVEHRLPGARSTCLAWSWSSRR